MTPRLISPLLSPKPPPGISWGTPLPSDSHVLARFRSTTHSTDPQPADQPQPLAMV